MKTSTMKKDFREKEVHALLDYLEHERSLSVWEGFQVLTLSLEAIGYGLTYKKEKEDK